MATSNSTRPGSRYGQLTVLLRIENSASDMPRWLCQCDCGSLPTVVFARNLSTGNTTSCGCAQRAMMRKLKRTHGKRRTPTYSIWANMKTRCGNPNVESYADYGGRGIRVCDRWMSFANFLADMGERPDGSHLDRSDNDGPYSPENCRWVTPQVNANNTRKNHRVDYQGKSLTIAELSRLSGVNYPALLARIRLGWPVERAAATAVRPCPRSTSPDQPEQAAEDRGHDQRVF